MTRSSSSKTPIRMFLRLAIANTYPRSHSIIAIAGLYGDSKSSWAKERPEPMTDNPSFWFGDCFGNVRVMTYDYDRNDESGAWYTRQGINKEAYKLLEGLLKDRKDVSLHEARLFRQKLTKNRFQKQDQLFLCPTISAA